MYTTPNKSNQDKLRSLITYYRKNPIFANALNELLHGTLEEGAVPPAIEEPPLVQPMVIEPPLHEPDHSDDPPHSSLMEHELELDEAPMIDGRMLARQKIDNLRAEFSIERKASCEFAFPSFNSVL